MIFAPPAMRRFSWSGWVCRCLGGATPNGWCSSAVSSPAGGTRHVSPGGRPSRSRPRSARVCPRPSRRAVARRVVGAVRPRWGACLGEWCEISPIGRFLGVWAATSWAGDESTSTPTLVGTSPMEADPGGGPGRCSSPGDSVGDERVDTSTRGRLRASFFTESDVQARVAVPLGASREPPPRCVAALGSGPVHLSGACC